MKLISAAFVMAVACAVGLVAQSETSTDKNETAKNKVTVEKKVDVKDGTPSTVRGCVRANPQGGGYILTNSQSGKTEYALVTNDDLSTFVDRRVQVTGTATDKGDGNVKIDSKTTIENGAGTADARSSETRTSTTTKGPMAGHFFGVKTMKFAKGACR